MPSRRNANLRLEIQSVQNLTVLSVLSDNQGNYAPSGNCVVKGLLHVRPAGAIWDASFPFASTVYVYGHADSGHIGFSIKGTKNSTEVLVNYLLPEYEGEIMKGLGNLKHAKVASDSEKAMENRDVRVLWWDHPRNTIVVQELPTKPVKRQLRRMEYNTQYLLKALHPGSPFLSENLLQSANLSSGMNYDQVVRALDGAMEKAKAEVLRNEAHQQYPNAYPKHTEADFARAGFPQAFRYESMVKFLDVEPSDYKPVHFEGRDFGGTAKWSDFKFTSTRDDDKDTLYSEGMSAYYTAKSHGGARKLFKLLKADPLMVKNMTLEQFTDLLSKSKIAFEYLPTVWR